MLVSRPALRLSQFNILWVLSRGPRSNRRRGRPAWRFFLFLFSLLFYLFRLWSGYRLRNSEPLSAYSPKEDDTRSRRSWWRYLGLSLSFSLLLGTGALGVGSTHPVVLLMDASKKIFEIPKSVPSAVY